MSQGSVLLKQNNKVTQNLTFLGVLVCVLILPFVNLVTVSVTGGFYAIQYIFSIIAIPILSSKLLYKNLQILRTILLGLICTGQNNLFLFPQFSLQVIFVHARGECHALNKNPGSVAVYYLCVRESFQP